MAFRQRVDEVADAIIIGGGFYGSAIAIYLARQRGLKRLLLVEQGPALLTRASFNNQARVHNGYHYARSFITAYRSRINFPRFVTDWPMAIKRDFTNVYAVARRNSKVSAGQFKRFCREIGARLEPADVALRQLFEPRLIEDVFVTEEFALDAGQLAQWAGEELRQCGIEIRLDTRALGISRGTGNALQVLLSSGNGHSESVCCRYAFNCTYSALNQLGGDFPGLRTPLKQEIAEIALLQAPPVLAGLGVTVMDGPFFSMMPFPPRGLHSLSHVRYTPHLHWQDKQGINPYQKLRDYGRESRVDRMLRDVARYLPAITDSKYVDSLFEVKTVLVNSESDDGRPILIEKHPRLPGLYSILGGKIDNIYDVQEALANEKIL